MKKLLLLAISVITLQVNAQIYMYGTTYGGGAYGLGTIYRVDQNGQNFQKLFDFTNSTGTRPLAGLTFANGKLYGFTTENGPANTPGALAGLGSFFSFDPLTNTFEIIASLDDASPIGNSIYHSPVLANDGLFYFASAGYDLGNEASIISSYDPQNDVLTVLDTLDVNIYGQIKGKLMQASNNHIYFTTSNGGDNGTGTLTRWNTGTNQLERLHSSPGIDPLALGYKNAQNGLLEGSDGKLYGLSLQGGLTVDQGVFFNIELDGTGYNPIKSFTSAVANEGWFPYGGLIEKNGIIYGTTSQENAQDVNSGTIFSYTLSSNSFSFIYTLDLEGYRPKGTLTESTNGRFYFTTTGEPNLDLGSLVEYNPLNGNVTKRHSFGGTNGSKPYYDQLAIVDFSLLSIDESSAQLNNINIYPNPVKDILNVVIEETGEFEIIKILDLKGSELFIDKSKTTKKEINTSFLPSGVYLLYVQTISGSTTRKIIIE